jgi:predicted nucleotidyltransferase component of viral defense system
LKKDTVYFRQAELLLRVLPFVNEEEVFALKGGTAINFFLRDLPRLSIDIDLTYLPINDREAALTDIDKALLRISVRVDVENQSPIYPGRMGGHSLPHYMLKTVGIGP